MGTKTSSPKKNTKWEKKNVILKKKTEKKKTKTRYTLYSSFHQSRRYSYLRAGTALGLDGHNLLIHSGRCVEKVKEWMEFLPNSGEGPRRMMAWNYYCWMWSASEIERHPLVVPFVGGQQPPLRMLKVIVLNKKQCIKS